MTMHPHQFIVDARRAEFEARAERARLARLAREARRPGRIRTAAARRLVVLAGRLDSRWQAAAGAAASVVRTSAAGLRPG